MKCESWHIWEQACEANLPRHGHEDEPTLVRIQWIPHYRRDEWNRAGRPNWWEELWICEECALALQNSFETDSDEDFYNLD